MSDLVTDITSRKIQKQLMLVLNHLMHSANINISQLSRNTGLANTTIKRMMTDPNCNPTLSSIKSIADFFGISINQLIGDEPLEFEVVGYYPNFKKWQKIPILNLTQACDWPNNIEIIRESKNTSYIYTDIEITEQTFAIKTNDETCEPKFSKGTILIFKKELLPKNKDYILVLHKGKGLPQIRQVLIDGSDQYVKPINPEFFDGRPQIIEKGEFQILGILVQAKSNFN